MIVSPAGLYDDDIIMQVLSLTLSLSLSLCRLFHNALPMENGGHASLPRALFLEMTLLVLLKCLRPLTSRQEQTASQVLFSLLPPSLGVYPSCPLSSCNGRALFAGMVVKVLRAVMPQRPGTGSWHGQRWVECIYRMEHEMRQ
jgi:hypothetical protein